MTVLSDLAAKISASSANIKAFASESARETDDLRARVAKLEAAPALTPGASVSRQFGFSTGSGPDTITWTGFDVPRYMQAAKNAGASIMRMDCWTLDPNLDMRVRAAVNAGMDVYLTFPTVRDPALVSAAVAKYRPLGVRKYETANEPNLRGWAGSVDPDLFRRTNNSFYDAIKGAAPDATVISGGLAAWGAYGAVETEGWNEVTFLEKLYALGPFKFDALGQHPYFYGDNYTAEQCLSHSTVWCGWAHMNWSSPSLRSVMAAHGDAAKPIYVTEWGAPTDGGAFTAGMSEAEQARLLQLGIAEWRSLPWAGDLYVYSLQDRPVDVGNREGHFGLLHADWSLKPSYGAFKQAVA